MDNLPYDTPTCYLQRFIHSMEGGQSVSSLQRSAMSIETVYPTSRTPAECYVYKGWQLGLSDIKVSSKLRDSEGSGAAYVNH